MGDLFFKPFNSIATVFEIGIAKITMNIHYQ